MTRFAKFVAASLVLTAGLAASISAASAADFRDYFQAPIVDGRDNHDRFVPVDHGHFPFWLFLRHRHEDRQMFDRPWDRQQSYGDVPAPQFYAPYGGYGY